MSTGGTDASAGGADAGLSGAFFASPGAAFRESGFSRTAPGRGRGASFASPETRERGSQFFFFEDFPQAENPAPRSTAAARHARRDAVAGCVGFCAFILSPKFSTVSILASSRKAI
jgi:hypothetical protein